MISSLAVLALVTARGGSKGLPGKNIRPLCGKPLIAWSVEAARAAASVDRIVVSTDSEAIAAAAAAAGAEVPFMRPAELATDTASSINVVIHALDALGWKDDDLVVLLEPTSPLREAVDIDAALARLVETGATAVVSVAQAGSAHPAFVFRQDSGGRLSPFLERPPTGLRRQDIEPVYYLDGSLYASRVGALRRRRSFYHDDTVAYEIAKWKSPEIDDLDDFIVVEALMARRGSTR